MYRRLPTFDVSLAFFEKENAANFQDAVELLRVLSFFHFEYIPVEIFTRGVKNQRGALATGLSNTIGQRLLNAVLKRVEPPRLLPRCLRDERGKLDAFRVNRIIVDLRSLSLVS